MSHAIVALKRVSLMPAFNAALKRCSTRERCLTFEFWGRRIVGEEEGREAEFRQKIFSVAKKGISKRESKHDQMRKSTGEMPVPPEVCNLPERLHRCRFIILHIENGIQLGDLQQVVHLFCQVQQLEFAALVLGGSVGADQFANP